MATEATIKRGLARYKELTDQIAELRLQAEKIRDWLGKNADGFEGTVSGMSVTVSSGQRYSVDTKAIREASLSNPEILSGLRATWAVPAKYDPTEEQMKFIRVEPTPTKITFKE